MRKSNIPAQLGGKRFCEIPMIDTSFGSIITVDFGSSRSKEVSYKSHVEFNF